MNDSDSLLFAEEGAWRLCPQRGCQSSWEVNPTTNIQLYCPSMVMSDAKTCLPSRGNFLCSQDLPKLSCGVSSPPTGPVLPGAMQLEAVGTFCMHLLQIIMPLPQGLGQETTLVSGFEMVWPPREAPHTPPFFSPLALRH